ncbi:MAG: PilZ domain-containing protein [Deltaproteobacteria bacterium]|nr:PilZ domain-containing protein [Deltaproteobacteria bacterium]
MEQERRTRTRVPLAYEATIIIDKEEIPVETWNLSLRGMQCTPDSRFNEGKTCSVVFTLNQETKITIDAHIKRSTDKEAGLYFATMEENSFYHLKRLVQYNTDDPDKIENELAGPVNQE